METFIKKYIRNEDDLPKEGTLAFWHLRGKDQDINLICLYYNTECGIDFENDYDWYLLPHPELLELIKAQQKMIDYLLKYAGKSIRIDMYNQTIAQLRKEVGI